MMATEHSWRAHAWTALAERRPDVARESARKARQWRRLAAAAQALAAENRALRLALGLAP